MEALNSVLVRHKHVGGRWNHLHYYIQLHLMVEERPLLFCRRSSRLYSCLFFFLFPDKVVYVSLLGVFYIILLKSQQQIPSLNISVTVSSCCQRNKNCLETNMYRMRRMCVDSFFFFRSILELLMLELFPGFKMRPKTG